jgi:hypothetical protein
VFGRARQASAQTYRPSHPRSRGRPGQQVGLGAGVNYKKLKGLGLGLF